MTRIKKLGYRTSSYLLYFNSSLPDLNPIYQENLCKEYFTTTSYKRPVVRRPACHKLCIDVVQLNRLSYTTKHNLLYNKADEVTMCFDSDFLISRCGSLYFQSILGCKKTSLHISHLMVIEYGLCSVSDRTIAQMK